MNLYNDLVSCNFDGCTPDDLKGIESRASDAVSDLMLGVSTIGSLKCQRRTEGGNTNA